MLPVPLSRWSHHTPRPHEPRPNLGTYIFIPVTNAIERRFREVRRRTRPMGVFSDRTSMDRILYAVFTHENRNQGVSNPLLLTQNI